MKGKVIRVVLVVFVAFLLAGACSAQSRIATVNVRRIFEGYWKTKQADSALRDRSSELEKEIKDMVADYNKAKDDYQTLRKNAEDITISTTERDKRKQAAEGKLKDMKDMEDSIAKYRRSAQVQIEDQSKRMHDNILGEIINAVKTKAKAAGYSMAVDTAAETATGAPVILYTNNENDITDDVLKQLNSSAPRDLPKADDTASDNRDGKPKDGKK